MSVRNRSNFIKTFILKNHEDKNRYIIKKKKKKKEEKKKKKKEKLYKK